MINLFIKTYGCQANVADSQSVENYLVSLGGVQVVDKEELADLILINTCAIREKAEQRVFSYIGELAEFKKNKSYLNIGVIGCMASYLKKEILTRFDNVSFVFGAKDDLNILKEYLHDLIVKLETIKEVYEHNNIFEQDNKIKFELKKIKRIINSKNIINKNKNLSDLALGGIKNKFLELKQSFINIMTGCNNYCSYCIVPFTRGREKSYPSNILLDRIKKDLDLGVKEITLLGQNVNSYKDPITNNGFEWLMEQVAKLNGDFWVRFVSSHPKDMTIDLLHVMANYSDKLCAYVHFPLQSGSNKILQSMNRTYTIEKYMEQIDWIRKILPQATITTDIIVGFPGETEQDYLMTRKIIEQVRYDLVYSFIYSPRKYTKASLMEDNCPIEEKNRRLQELQTRQMEICFENNLLTVGKTFKTLVEKRLTNGKLLTRTAGNLRVLYDGNDDLIGNFVNLKIQSAGRANLVGSLIK
ncbi:tRNA (N6-isopentenyl adenosine(37)-C2)-methylthiotransferase MiaB [Candidatus Babeliales bacterium]|nr:tRNA (N6-isopentenyl adenosine(37)-C2)-methylthiotransferase MiaB [Candidatus Babeliales bacterium]MCF7899232.1 tRNA (N6-isopentenyl adenosine(37)-C2)-methylthiotransferase MiaB [Candidatus Babeliales bacterium]